jgi:hypothetical protein
VQFLTAQGQVVEVIGKGQASNEDGQFNGPRGICGGPKAEIFVTMEIIECRCWMGRASLCASLASRAKETENSITPMMYDVSLLDRQHAPSSAASSLLLVADYNNQRMSVWSADGSQHINNVKLNGYAYGLCVDLNGFVCASSYGDAHTVQIMDPRAGFACLQTLGSPSSAGSAPGQFNTPSGLCVDDQNTLFVVDYGNHRVQIFD